MISIFGDFVGVFLNKKAVICGDFRLGREAGLPAAKISTAIGRVNCELQGHNI